MMNDQYISMKRFLGAQDMVNIYRTASVVNEHNKVGLEMQSRAQPHLMTYSVIARSL